MVKLTFSMAAMAATLASVATAVPFGRRPMTPFSSRFGPNECIPETNIKEYHPFYLESYKLQSLVSKHAEDNVIVGGINGNKNFQQLEFCIVSSDYGCDKHIPSNCIYQNVEYRFRVNGPVEGYLQVDGEHLKIVENFHEASGLNLYKEAGWGLRIAHLRYDGSREVLATNGGGNPLSLEKQVTNEARQWFGLIEADYNARVEPNQCVPEVDIKEYHPFQLKSSKLQSLVSLNMYNGMISGGRNGDKNFEQLELCIVSSDLPCNKVINSNCIYQNVQYRFRVEGPIQGYLTIRGDQIVLTRDFNDAAPLNLYKEAGWGLRIEHLQYDGLRLVFATHGAGNPLGLEPFVKDEARQWFTLESNDEDARVAPNECIPEVDIKEYHPFQLKNSKLQSLVSKRIYDRLVVGGVNDDKTFQQLELCIVSSDMECDRHIQSHCIYQNVEYRFRVNGPVQGYLKIVGDNVIIVNNFREASGLNLYKEAGWGLRIAQYQYDGSRLVFATNGPGAPLTVEPPKKDDSRQWFSLIENEYRRRW